jgi:hypothetical protein
MSGYLRMQLISVILFIISVGLIVGPVGAVVYTYREDLSGLVIPSQLKDLLQGDTSQFLNDANNGDGGSFLSGLLEPVFVGSTVDSQTRTFTMTVNITNNFTYDLTLNSLSADVESTQDNYHLVTISLSEPVTMISGEAATVIVNGQWSQEAEALFLNNYSQEPSIDVALDNVIIDLNGITVESTEPFPIGNIPLSLAA